MLTTENVFQSRADQAAEFLREKIQAGFWQKKLPAQRELAHELGISRRALASALSELQREGVVINRSQGGMHIARQRRARRITDLSVGIVYSSHVKRFVGRELQLLNEMRQIFQARKIRTEIHKVPYPFGERVSNRFEKLIRGTVHHCWILVAPTTSMQMWCKEHGIPALVFGISDDAGGLPSVGVDHYALCRHAVGEMLRRGHRRLCLVLPSEEKGEDIQSRIGVEAGIRNSPHEDVTLTFEHHDQTIPGVCRLADRLLRGRSRPTAWLICRQGHYLTVLSHLLHQKVEIPRQISLISRDSDIYIGDIVPEPTRYVANFEFMARQGARKALKIMTGQSVYGERLRLMPNFVLGQTLGPVPAGS